MPSCLGERGAPSVLSVLASRKGGFIRGSLGEESGLLPVGLQGATERQFFFPTVELEQVMCSVSTDVKRGLY